MPSGVIRLRNSRKTQENPRMANPRSGKGNDVKPNVNVGSGLAPKKSSPFTNYAGVTPPPKGRALPVRGEGPTRNIDR